MIKKANKKPPTEAQKERGREFLFSLKILTNVVFALLLFQIFMILPRPDDPLLEYYTLGQIFSGYTDKLVEAEGIIKKKTGQSWHYFAYPYRSILQRSNNGWPIMILLSLANSLVQLA